MPQKGYGIGLDYPIDRPPTGLFLPVAIDLGVGESKRIDTSPRKVYALTVSVLAGSLDIWLGDYTGTAAPQIPHLHFTAGRPKTIDLPLNHYVFTVFGPGIGSIIPVG